MTAGNYVKPMLALARAGECSMDEAMIAVGMLSLASWHPELQRELEASGELDLAYFGGLINKAGFTPPWER